MNKVAFGITRISLRVCVAMLVGAAACVLQAAPLIKIENCTLIPTDWADGDSFRIQIPEKAASDTGPGHKAREITVRLYGADCIESVAHNDSDARRLRAQRRYFGITEAGGNAQASIALALKFGKQAGADIPKLLAEPFTIHTSFADGRGDPKFKRYYAFVTTADGRDLAALLVSRGLARAFGVYRETPDGRHRDDYREELADLEMRAAKKGAGVWQHTDWDKLPAERRAQRTEERELEIAQGKNLLPSEEMHINKASKEELMRLPGIGEAMANRIIEGRPYQNPTDLLKVKGIGKTTLENIKTYLKFPTP